MGEAAPDAAGIEVRVTNNDVLRSIRYLLNVPDARMAEIFVLGGAEVTPAQVVGFLQPERTDGFLACDDRAMALFLDGLVYARRGKDPARPAPPIELPMTNNIVLKKLRVAFELKEDDILAIMATAGFDVARPELSAFFRSAGHKHYRPCGDQFLRNFLKGLTYRVRR